MKGKFIVISGPGGVGKDTIAKELVKMTNIIYSVSMTTRKIRSNEVDGKDYFFVDKNTFEDNIKNNNILEYTFFNGNYHGTPRDFVFNNIDKGIDVIAVLDIKGALNIEKIYPSAISIFIMPPTFEELERRIRERGTDSEDVIRQSIERGYANFYPINSYSCKTNPDTNTSPQHEADRSKLVRNKDGSFVSF